jgi:SAM-dependent methyltransferase
VLATNLAQYFDAVIPWEKRLARELPLVEGMARQAGRRILIPACGAGGHLVALAERGFDVLGFDIAEDALQIANSKIGAAEASIRAAGGAAHVQQLNMERAVDLGAQFDVAFCLGNALPGISGPGQLLAALRGVAGALRPGGIFLTQNLNCDLRWREKTQFFPVLSGATAEEEVLLVKFADYDAAFINFHALYLVRSKAGGAWQSHIRTSRWIPLLRDRLLDLLSQAGSSHFDCWGDYAKTPFDAAKSNDLIVKAEKIH